MTARSQVEAISGSSLEGRALVFDSRERPVLKFAATFKIARNARIRKVSSDSARQDKSKVGIREP
ncbi:MAG: hypothetical protein JJV98_07365 [Desulfosarcina sp.]|nr:hypothetical protein [Desulfobacterales bacterium]